MLEKKTETNAQQGNFINLEQHQRGRMESFEEKEYTWLSSLLLKNKVGKARAAVIVQR